LRWPFSSWDAPEHRRRGRANGPHAPRYRLLEPWFPVLEIEFERYLADSLISGFLCMAKVDIVDVPIY
jgi:hypothetical protein